MTLTDCQLLSIVAQLGTFAAAAERLHITPSAVSHAVSGVEAECGFPLFTRTKSGVTLTAAAEKDNVFGCQFHPEKSGEKGLRILKAFCTVK